MITVCVCDDVVWFQLVKLTFSLIHYYARYPKMWLFKVAIFASRMKYRASSLQSCILRQSESKKKECYDNLNQRHQRNCEGIKKDKTEKKIAHSLKTKLLCAYMNVVDFFFVTHIVPLLSLCCFSLSMAVNFCL